MSSPRYARARATRSSAFGSARSTVFGMDAVDKRCDEANGEEAQQVIQNERPETSRRSRATPRVRARRCPYFRSHPDRTWNGELSSGPDNLALEGG